MFTHSHWATRRVLTFVTLTVVISAFALIYRTAQDSSPVIAFVESIQRHTTVGVENAVSLSHYQREDDGSTGNSTSTSTAALIHLENKKLAPSVVRVASADHVIEKRFNERNQNAHQICGNLTSKDLNPINRLKGLKTLFAYNKYSWCRIPKVGTTFLTHFNHVAFGPGSRISGGRKKSFFIVREPYSRMVSAYIGKIVTNQPWWQIFGRHIVNNFRMNATQKEKDCGNDVTFPEFVKYFIHSQTTGVYKNNHFIPMFELCNPCNESFDYILHLETLKDDLPYILEAVNVTGNQDFSNEIETITVKARSIVSQRKQISLCEQMCTALCKVWWSFHARGLIFKDITFPLKEEECDSISEDEFASIALEAHARSVGQIDKSKQQRETLVELFLQVPLSDRLKVRDLLSIDFRLYRYDSQPKELFPELWKN